MNSINTNLSNLIAQNALKTNNALISNSLRRLSTGFRINTGADDPAGLVSSENLRAALAALESESRQMERADHVASTADAALGETSELLGRAEELTVANANEAGLSESERAANQMEIDSILQSVDRIAQSTSFNGDSLLDGSATITLSPTTSLSFGSASSGDIGEVEIDGETYILADIGSGGGLSDNPAGAQEAIRAARTQIAQERGRIGAFQKNTIASRMASVNVALENISAAESLIRDTDFAFETANLSRLQILGAASLNAVGTTNAQRQTVLMLLGG